MRGFSLGSNAAAAATGLTVAGATTLNFINPIAANARAERVEVLDAAGSRMFGSQLEDASGLGYSALADDAEITIEANPGLRLRAFNIDAGGMQARGVIERLIKAQSAAMARPGV